MCKRNKQSKSQAPRASVYNIMRDGREGGREGGRGYKVLKTNDLKTVKLKERDGRVTRRQEEKK